MAGRWKRTETVFRYQYAPFADTFWAARTVLTAVPDTIWSRSEDGTLLQARFSADIGDGLNNLLRRLAAAGVGTQPRSALSVWPSSLRVHRNAPPPPPPPHSVGAPLQSQVRPPRPPPPSPTPTPIPIPTPTPTTAAPMAAPPLSTFVSPPFKSSPPGGLVGNGNANVDGGDAVGNGQAAGPGTGTRPFPPAMSSPAAWYEFVGAAAERLAMARAVQAAEADARLTFDFVCLLLIAAFLAALGLVENSTEILVASMLISPLMGPIMAFTLGTLGRERRLQRRGVRVEVLGLAGCLLLGFLFGLAAAGVTGGAPPAWPTREMRARGELHAVWVGALVALLSGAAVALATLGGYTASLVGVAISAALLPPAINAGLLWSLACATLLTRRDVAGAVADAADALNRTANVSALADSPPLAPLPAPTLDNHEALAVAADLAMQGALSVCLTLLNILCIFVAAMIVLKAKQVSPTAEDRVLLRLEDAAWLDAERPASPPAAPSSCRRRHWSMAQPPTLSRRVSLLVQQAPGLQDHSGCDTCTRTWSPGGRPSRSSLQDLRNLYLSGAAGPANPPSQPTRSPTAQPPPPASKSPVHQVATVFPPPVPYVAPPARRPPMPTICEAPVGTPGTPFPPSPSPTPSPASTTAGSSSLTSSASMPVFPTEHSPVAMPPRPQRFTVTPAPDDPLHRGPR